MTEGIVDCPFMMGHEAVCTMSFADHIDAWKTAFVVVMPTITFLFVILSTSLLWFVEVPHLRTLRYKPILTPYWQLRERGYSFPLRLFQELSSNGILHPKVF